MQKKIKWEKTGLNINSRHEIEQRKKVIRYTAIILAILALVIFLTVRKLRSDNTYGRLAEFERAISETNYDQAIELYREVQKGAVDEVSKDNESPYKEVQLAMEDLVSERVRGICERVLQGQALTVEERDYIAGLRDISAVEIMPLIYERSEAWLDGKIDEAQWEALIQSFLGLRNLEPMLSDLYQQKPGLELAVERFKIARGIQEKGDWELTWQYWQDIVDDPSMAIYAQNYAELHLKEYQEREYQNLLRLADELFERKRYYSARRLLDRMYGVFPDRGELGSRLEAINAKLPEKLDKWQEAVPVLAIRPLIARENLAFNIDKEHDHASKNLLTTKEFTNLLNALKADNYVLIRPSIFYRYPESEVNVIVPRGKKPIILILENACYSTLNQANGTVQKLLYADGQFQGFYEEVRGQTREANNNFFGVLEQFIEDNPDFSFDGGKAIISFYLREDALGYILTEDMLESQNEARKNQSLKPYIMDQEDYKREQETFQELLSRLVYAGYEPAVGGLGTTSYNRLGLTELQSEIELWQRRWQAGGEESLPLILNFPEGGHVYNQQAELDYLLGQGYRLMIGMGPKPYNFYFQSFVHLDRQTVSPSSLQAVESFGLDQIMPSASWNKILDYASRGY